MGPNDAPPGFLANSLLEDGMAVLHQAAAQFAARPLIGA
jgi:hypothetical protein